MKNTYSLIALSLLLQLSIIIPAAYFLEQYTQQQMLKAERSELEHIAAATLFALPSFHPDVSTDEQVERLDDSIQNLSEALAARTTLVNSSGRVLADSEIETALISSLENHANRPEIEQALNNGVGYSVRYSDRLGHDVMYVALRVQLKPLQAGDSVKQETMIIRASRPLDLIAHTISGFHAELLKVGAAITTLSIVMSIVGVSYLSRQISKDSNTLETRVEDRIEEILMLQMLNSLLNTCESLDEASEVIVKLAPRLLPNTSGGISIYTASRNRLDLLSQWGENFNSRTSLNPHDCWALRKGHQHQATSRGIVLPCEHWTEEAIKTICIPLLAQGETVGVLHIDYQNGEISSDATHIRESIAEQIGLTLANIQLRQQLREQAQRDAMTGLYNRTYLAENMENFLHSEKDISKECAVLMLDADHFKRFNDNFGHDAGDLVLKAIANEIYSNSGTEGLACRYGGEEFCVFLPGADRETALVCAESMRLSIAGLNLSLNNLPLGNVTVSIGIALGPEHAIEQKALISYSDEALYKAKEAGRDQIVIFENPRSAAIDYIKNAG